MKLYYSPGACSLATHIALEEAGITYETERVDTKTKKTAGGKDFFQINPKGYVPVLELDNKETLTEGAVILQYVADQRPEKNLIPKAGTIERYRCQSWLNYVATEIHKGFSPLWNSKVPEETKGMIREAMTKKFEYLSNYFQKNNYLMGAQFTVADAYLYTCMRWSQHLGIDLARWPKLLGYMETVGTRPCVHKAVQAEGLK